MAPEGGEIDELLSSRIKSGYPRDLLRRFTGSSAGGDGRAEVGGGDMDEIELGLSLGGCYAAETKGKGLVRASSMFPGERIDSPAVTTPLTRACSLPTETEEERRKRKEMECLKRMEAKRKRSEKKAAAAAAANNNRKEENLLDVDLVSKAANGIVVPDEVAKWAAAIGGRGGKRPASQGSIGSQGSSSSGVSDFDNRPVQGVDVSGVGNCAEVRGPSTIPSAADRTNHRAAATTSKQVVGKPAKLSREGDEPSRKKSCTSSKLNRVKETERNVLGREREKMSSFLLPILTTKKEVDRMIRDTLDKVLVLRFGRPSDSLCLHLDDILGKSWRDVSKFADVALVDVDAEQVQVYVNYFDITLIPSTVFFFNAHHMKMDSGTADHTKWIGSFHSKQDFIDVAEAIFRGAMKGKLIVSCPLPPERIPKFQLLFKDL